MQDRFRPHHQECGNPLSARLESLSLGALTLTPTFDPDTTEYAATTTNASNKLTVSAEDDEATIEVKLGDDVVTAGSDGKYALTWETGENEVTIKVTCRAVSKTYTLTVTAS